MTLEFMRLIYYVVDHDDRPNSTRHTYKLPIDNSSHTTRKQCPNQHVLIDRKLTRNVRTDKNLSKVTKICQIRRVDSDMFLSIRTMFPCSVNTSIPTFFSWGWVFLLSDNQVRNGLTSSFLFMARVFMWEIKQLILLTLTHIYMISHPFLIILLPQSILTWKVSITLSEECIHINTSLYFFAINNFQSSLNKMSYTILMWNVFWQGFYLIMGLFNQW